MNGLTFLPAAHSRRSCALGYPALDHHLCAMGFGDLGISSPGAQLSANCAASLVSDDPGRTRHRGADAGEKYRRALKVGVQERSPDDKAKQTTRIEPRGRVTRLVVSAHTAQCARRTVIVHALAHTRSRCRGRSPRSAAWTLLTPFSSLDRSWHGAGPREKVCIHCGFLRMYSCRWTGP